MKKFSKLFARRLGRSSDGDDRTFTRETSPDVHQLTSRRRNGDAKTTPKSGVSLIVVDEEHPPCATCKTINFPRLLDWQPGQPRPWISLSHTLNDSSCPYCTFFQAMVGTHPDETRKYTPYLRIRLAFERLGMGEKHELGRSVLIEVTTKTKSLPWGYIIKAVENESDAEESSPTKDIKVSAIQGRTIPRLLDPALPKSWVDFCKEHHGESCWKREAPINGLKLIDCETHKVVSADDLDAETLEYVTLSYVRGETRRASVDDWTLWPEHLPQMITDAISFTIRLGFRYLWVDRYCMPSPHADETGRARQLDLVGDILASSSLTLIVAAGLSVLDGIPGVSVPREEQLSLKTETGLFTTSLLRPDFEVHESKWAASGWTYQEGLLSRRRLFFTPSQIYFQCDSLHCHETMSLPLHLTQGLNGRVFPTSEALSRPGQIKNQIGEYMTKAFTHDDDKLEAFRGVLHKYAQMEKAVTNFLGLPLFHVDEFQSTTSATRTDQLAVALGWTNDSAVPPEGYVSPLSYSGTFPSWTWLAWRVKFGSQLTGNQNFRFSLVEEASPVAAGVCAAPKTEISIGFDEESVLSWESDEEAINEKSKRAQFLRFEAFCFDIRIQKKDGSINLTDSPLGKSSNTLVRAWYESINPEASDGDYELTAMLISGRSWAGGADSTANILVCGKHNGEADAHLMRLGLLTLSIEALEVGETDEATLKMTETDGEEKKTVQLRRRRVDLY
jgi:hypothetical protein